MGKLKKFLIGLLIVALIVSGAAAGLMQIRKNSQKEVMVTNVSGLISEYYMPSTTLDGSVTTSVSQNVTVDSDMIIEQVFVNQGDRVKTGDPLVSFDTTLVEMELNIDRLKHQQLERDLNKAIKRLYSLENGGPVMDSDYQGADNLNGMQGEDMASAVQGKDSGMLLAAVMHPLLAASFVEEGPEFNDSVVNDFVSEGDSFTDGDDTFGSGEEERPKPSPTPSPDPEDGGTYDPYFKPGLPDITDGKETFYETLDSHSRPFAGTGTKEDPFIFLVSSYTGEVKAMGSFYNRMAGYTEDGTRVEKEGGYWYQLEFHQGNTIMDYLDRKQSCIGYYLVDGSLLAKPVYMYVESGFTVDGASQYEPEYPEEPDYPGGGGQIVSPISRKEAIRMQRNKIAGLKLDIQESEIKMAKLEKKVNRRLINSKLDGVVSYVGDAVTGESYGNAFIKVQSGDGFYVVGTVGELMLDDFREGQTINCMSYQSGNFEAKVLEVSDYPMEGNSYWGNNNPNVSYYSFTAEVQDKTKEFPDYDYINITLESSAAHKGSLVLQKAFVRKENGESYVYKDDNGVLKKQVLTVGPAVDGGYSVLVKGGLSREDKIAFPYGKAVKEGAKTRIVELDEMYGY